MQETKKRLFALALALWALSSCSQDASDVQGSATGGETVTFSLNAEVSVDDEQTRAIDYKLGSNAQGQLVPMPQFTDGQEVEVHTILKSSNGAVAAKTLKWKYSAASKKLVLSQDSHDIEVSGFNNDNGTKWYISGLIGGALNGTQVEFMGSRVVKGVDGNAGNALGSMEVPYAFGWTELTINTSSPKDSEGSHKYAIVPPSKNVKFQPLGSMLAVKLGSNQSAGAYTFTPKGFTLSSNAWGDQGSFELSTTIPTADPHTALPTWTEGACSGSMYYTFANGEEPGAIAHNQTTAKTYYVWVMPHKTLPTTADVRVMLKGTSSRAETETYKDYTNTWFTDYTTEGKATQGKVTQGRVHPLTAKVSHRLALPIEYVTEYNLAGGEGLTYTVRPGIGSTDLSGSALGGVQPAGVTGPLRFATSHSNDQSGYYNFYKVVGRYDETYNPDTRNLQTEVDNTFGAGNYFIPTMDHWWGVYPSAGVFSRRFAGATERSNALELMGVGLDGDILRQTYLSDYSQSFTSPHGGNDETDNAVLYAIRFKARTDNCSSITFPWDYDATTNSAKSYTYPSALDNSMKCAYRFTRVGGGKSWREGDNSNLTNRLIIDVVYLGEESVPTDLSTISDELWWATKQSQGHVLSKTFPAAGSIHTYNSVFGALNRSTSSQHWSSSQHSEPYGWNMHTSSELIVAGSYLTGALDGGLSVRLFARRDY